MLIYKYQVCTKLYSGAQLCINSQFKPAGLRQVRAGSCISGIYRPLFWHGSMHAAWAEDLSSAWKISTPTAAARKASRALRLALKALGLDWDAGYPDIEYSQSQRNAKYDEVFDLLLHRDLLYPCYCSRSERLAASAPHPGEHRSDPGCKCRHLSFSERRELEAAGRKAAWKIKVPDKTISFCDGHYGEVFRKPRRRR